MSPLDDDDCMRVNERLAEWRQGDFVVDGEHWLVLRVEPNNWLAAEGSNSGEDVDLIEEKVHGFVVISQTCDIVRPCESRPWIEVCPLVQVDDSDLHKISKCRRPNYAYIPGAAGDNLVADLDRVMTLEKSVVAEWTRVEGCFTDDHVRDLACALARKRQRFAFPDDFSKLSKKLKDRMVGKHGKNSDEGQALLSLREIRVTASPGWNDDEVSVLFWFIRDEHDLTFKDRNWNDLLEAWLKYVPATGRFIEVDGVITTLEDMTARDYLESDSFDLDHLSTREG